MKFKSIALLTLRLKEIIFSSLSTLCPVSFISSKISPLIPALTKGQFRYRYRYIKTWRGVDYFVAAVNPSMSDLYEAFYLFEPFPSSATIDSYQFVKGAPAVPLVLPLNGFEAKLKNVYLKKNIKKICFVFCSHPTRIPMSIQIMNIFKSTALL